MTQTNKLLIIRYMSKTLSIRILPELKQLAFHRNTFFFYDFVGFNNRHKIYVVIFTCLLDGDIFYNGI